MIARNTRTAIRAASRIAVLRVRARRCAVLGHQLTTDGVRAGCARCGGRWGLL